MDEGDGLEGEAVQGSQSFFVAAAEGGDGGDVADEEGADEMVFAGSGDGFFGLGQGGVAVAEAGFDGGEGTNTAATTLAMITAILRSIYFDPASFRSLLRPRRVTESSTSKTK